MTISNEDIVLQNLMNKILLVAMEDGKITDDELAILKQVKLDINTLRERIQKVEIDISIKESDVKKLDKFSKDLLQNAYDISKSDHIITSDERKMINTLIKALVN